MQEKKGDSLRELCGQLALHPVRGLGGSADGKQLSHRGQAEVTQPEDWP